MESKMALVLPLISLVYLFQTLLKRKVKVYYKLPLIILSCCLLVFDVFVFLVFFINCLEAGLNYTQNQCIGWVYPTLDFKVMVVVSMVFLGFAFIGLVRNWGIKTYYTFGSIVLYIGVLFRLFLLVSAAEAISFSRGASNPVVFDIFSVVVVYGLISAAIYFSIFFLGLFTKNIHRQLQG